MSAMVFSETNETTMLDQENKTHVEQSTDNTKNNNKLSTPSLSTFTNSNPLNEHDYCSRAQQPQQHQFIKSQQLQQDEEQQQQQQTDDPKHHRQQQTRIRRPRQNTSVTDKSQWITGEEQVDSALSEHIGDGRQKRQRKEVHDPEFSQFTSSEYSSSDAESDQESEADSEDDPNRPWCTCEKPDDGLFMIECEICKYWFHGSCVGMTKAIVAQREKAGKREWFCSACDHALQSGTPREAIPLRLVKKEKKKTISKTGRRRGRPRKSDAKVEMTTRLSLRSAKRSSNPSDPSSKTKGKSNARIESYEKFDDQKRLKELIRERRKDFFRKHRLSEQLKADKIKEVGLGRHSITGSLGRSLDSLASSTVSPNMSNLPINIKSERKDKSKPNIVLQINTKIDSSAETSGQRLVTTIVKKRKSSESCDSSMNDLFTADPIQVNKKPKSHGERVSTPTIHESKVSGDAKSPDGQAKISATSDNNGQQPAREKKRKKSESSSANGSSKKVDSIQIIHQKIKECLDKGCNLEDFDSESINTEKIASEIVEQLNECFKIGSSKYLPKYRSLIFNMLKNQALVRNVLTGLITPSRLVRMSPDEMAPNELAKWRERENKHSIELIKRDAELAAQQVIVKKTHKGEEVIAAPGPNDPDDPTAPKEDQEIPSTPTKTPVKLETLKTSNSPPINEMSKSTESVSKNLNFEPPNAPDEPKLINLPTNATVCPDQSTVSDEQVAVAEKPSTPENLLIQNINVGVHSGKADQAQEPKVEAPKRLRVSIDTKLDPANLSRLTQPLIKREVQSESGQSSPSKMSPNAGPSMNGEVDDGNESEELYDPEIHTVPKHTPNEKSEPSKTNHQCWSGLVTMSEVPKFNAFAKPVSGNLDFMRDEINRTLLVCGRIPPDHVTSYIRKLKSTQKNQICLVQFYPSSEDDKAAFNTFFDHLYTRNRYGVIKTNNQSVLKDFYVLPIHEKGHIPEVLRPINGPGLDRKDTNCLLGLLIRANRPSSTSDPVLGYTPSAIK